MAYYAGYPGSPQYGYPGGGYPASPGRSPSPVRQFYQEEYITNRPPVRSARPPSPTRGMPRNTKYTRTSYNTRRIDPYDSYGQNNQVIRQYADYEAAQGPMMYSQGSTLTGRRCCTAFLAGLLLLSLAGLGAGIYFAITKTQASASSNSVSKLVSNKGYNGYYVNGVYVVPVTSKPRDIYIIYGTDTPCNRFNNNTVTNPIYPDCNQVTTKIAFATNWTTFKPPQIVVPVASATHHLAAQIVLLFICCLLGLAIVSDKGWSITR